MIVVVVVPRRVVGVEAAEVATELVQAGPKQAVVLGSEIVVVAAGSRPVAGQEADSSSAAVTHSSLAVGMTTEIVVLATERAAGRVVRVAVPNPVVVETAWEPPD